MPGPLLALLAKPLLGMAARQIGGEAIKTGIDQLKGGEKPEEAKSKDKPEETNAKF